MRHRRQSHFAGFKCHLLSNGGPSFLGFFTQIWLVGVYWHFGGRLSFSSPRAR